MDINRLIEEIPGEYLVRIILKRGLTFKTDPETRTAVISRNPELTLRMEHEVAFGIYKAFHSHGNTSLEFESSEEIPCTYNFSINENQIEGYRYWELDKT